MVAACSAASVVPDYQRLVDVAARLIGEAGRSIVVRRRAAPNPSRPWEPGALPTEVGADYAAVIGAQMRLTAAQRASTVIEDTDQRWLIAADGAPSDLGPEWEIVDGSASVSIVQAELIKPGPVAIYWDCIARA